MKHLCRFASVLFLGLLWGGGAEGALLGRYELRRTNKELHGQVLDFTHNHGQDRRIWSEGLHEKRDLYVYLPPGFDPKQCYPLGIFLHGATQDEQFFLQVVKLFDRAIAKGNLPPVLIAAPDGSLKGRPSFFHPATFFANTRAGRFEDFLMQDVWNFVMTNFPVRPEREAHALFGVSMGGSAAFANAIKHRERVGAAIGFAPALNVRWVDCHGNYSGSFHPDCWGWREKPRPLEVIGRPNPLVKMRFCTLYGPIVGKGQQAIAELASFNPIELMEQCNLQPGELDLYVAYGGQDEFNIAAQVESFLFLAQQRGIGVGVGYDPRGKHDFVSGVQMLQGALEWIAPRVAPYSPK